jgi:hypothetical protein
MGRDQSDERSLLMIRRLKQAARDVLVRGCVTGSGASVVSTLAITALSRRETGAAASGTNATSHWLWGRRAQRRHQSSLKYTATGYAVHHASSIWWGVIYEAWRALRREHDLVRDAGAAAAVAAVAWVVDYGVAPRRLTPGFEAHFSPRSMVLTYAAFAMGLFATGVLTDWLQDSRKLARQQRKSSSAEGIRANSATPDRTVRGCHRRARGR